MASSPVLKRTRRTRGEIARQPERLPDPGTNDIDGRDRIPLDAKWRSSASSSAARISPDSIERVPGIGVMLAADSFEDRALQHRRFEIISLFERTQRVANNLAGVGVTTGLH